MHEDMERTVAEKALRFNRSGRAVTADAFMVMPGTARLRAQKQGPGTWTSWTPEAVQRAGFSKGSLRQTLAEFKDCRGKAGSGSRSTGQVSCCIAACGQAILHGQAESLERLKRKSMHSKRFAFGVTNTMLDETEAMVQG